MKIVCMLMLLMTFGLVPLFAEFTISAGSDFEYSDNVFQLSNKDKGRFDDGDLVFDYIESRDDFIMRPDVEFGYKYQGEGFTLEPSISGTYDYYYRNTDKSNYSTLTKLVSDIRLSKDYRLTLAAYYGYYPDNWLRNYRDDETDSYQKFEYDKNLYKFEPYLRMWRKFYVMPYFKYEEYYHNEYFTEYDGDATTMGLGLKYAFNTFYMKVYYHFRDYECDNLPEGDIDNDADEAGDASYESNIYFLEFENKRVAISRHRYIRPFFSFQYEQRFFQTDGYDKFHSGREDTKYTVKFGSDFYLFDNLEFKLTYTHIYRNAESDFYEDIADYKEYQEDRFTLGVKYNLEF